jgi:cytochrome c-type biogenesis protein
MVLAGLSILAWMLTVLAPCVLPVLPVIMWGSLATQKWYKPLIIIGSAGIFIIVFTLLLRATTAFISIPDSFWWTVSGIIIIWYGLILLFPNARTIAINKIGWHKVHTIAHKAKQKWTRRWDVLLGASLWPIFATCSPTYALLLGIVFPQSFTLGTIYIILYTLGFVFLLTLVTYGWRAIIKKLQWASSADGLFKKILWVILIVTWILIMTGSFKTIETWLLDKGIWDYTNIEYHLIQKAWLQ